MGKLFIASIMPNGIKSSPDGKDHVHFSICFDINQDNPDLNSDLPDYPSHAKNFYRKFLTLMFYLTAKNGVPFKLKVERSGVFRTQHATLSNDAYWAENCQIDKLESIRRNLWLDLFSVSPPDAAARTDGTDILPFLNSMEHALLTDAPVQPNVTIGSISSLNKDNTLYNSIRNSGKKDLNYTLIDNNGLRDFLQEQPRSSKIYQSYNQSTGASQKYQEIGIRERVNFIAAKHPAMNTLEGVDILDLHRAATEDYVKNSIDLNELFITFSQLSHHPVLLRLFGLVIDFSVPLSKVKDWGKDFSLSVDDFDYNPFHLNGVWRLPKTKISRIDVGTKPLKQAFLVTPKVGSLYKNSLLDDKDAYLLNYDPMAQEQKLAAAREKVAQGVNDVSGEFHDSFTRGIIYNHAKIDQLILAPKVENETLYEENMAMGQRVVIKNVTQNDHWVSLTKRRTTIFSRSHERIYTCGTTESCIHFDHVGNYLDDKTAEIKHKSSESLFEFKGELLTLNTIFSRETKISKLERDNQELQNPPDPSVKKSQTRLNLYLDIDYYPYDGKVRDGVSPHAVQLRYALPLGSEREMEMAALKFGQTYQFLVYNQYKNGWGLPIYTEALEVQASLDDIFRLNRKGIKRPRNLVLKFKRLENSKPVILFSQTKIENGGPGDTGKLLEKDSLNSLVIRNNNDKSPAFRHVLPERIALEQAFWAGLMVSAMDSDMRFMWKCRYNCIQDKAPAGISVCDAGCGSFCGGTKMKDFYTGDFIRQEEVVYLPDPLVDGFTLQLFWDKDCSEKYMIGYGNREAVFEKANPVKVRSYGLVLKPLAKPAPGLLIENGQILVSNAELKAEIFLKPGMRAYALLYNHTLDPDNVEAWGHDYWINQVKEGSPQITLDDFKNQAADPKSQAKLVTLTHAMQKPLIKPEIFTFTSKEGNFSTDDNVIDLSYIDEWIAETVRYLTSGVHYPCHDRYHYLMDEATKRPAFSLDTNIIGLRPKDEKDFAFSMLGSTKITFELVSRFERLDAIRTNLFLPDTTPTGGLELWVSKEEFADDSAQWVFSRDAKGHEGQVNHFPEKPVYAFSDPKNQPYFDYKIDFKPYVLRQLKQKLNPEVLGSYQKYLKVVYNDPFMDTVSQLAATYDAKTTKFEIRKYSLLDTSKYKGYFTLDPAMAASDKNIETATNYTLESFQERSAQVPVMVLGNQSPGKPLVAFIVTTIHEKRSQAHKTTTTDQWGNRLTIYLNRDRLSSGRDERVAILVKNNSAYSKMYEDNDWLSKAGRDIVSDRRSPASHYICCDKTDDALKHIVIPKQDVNFYDARYDEKLSMVSYLPRFDIEKQLWKFEVEFNILTSDKKQLHNPFLNLALVHFQPFAINYNRPGNDPALELDCRLSEVDFSSFCYLLPHRNISATFDKPCLLDRWGEANITVSFDESSLHYFQKMAGKDSAMICRSNFIVCIEGSSDGQIWSPVMSQFGADWQLMHPLLDFDVIKEGGSRLDANGDSHVNKTIRFLKKSNPSEVGNHNSMEDHSVKFHKFRIRLVEVEWFLEENWKDLVDRYQQKEKIDIMQTDVLDNEDFRVRFIELIY